MGTVCLRKVYNSNRSPIARIYGRSMELLRWGAPPYRSDFCVHVRADTQGVCKEVDTGCSPTVMGYQRKFGCIVDSHSVQAISGPKKWEGHFFGRSRSALSAHFSKSPLHTKHLTDLGGEIPMVRKNSLLSLNVKSM